MMRSDIVTAAQGWIGTPYRHQASRKFLGADCLGLIRGIWREVMGNEPEIPPAYTPDWGEGGGRELLLNACLRYLHKKPLHDAALGDVLLFRMHPRAIAKHLGIQSHLGNHPRFIHAYSGHGVIESPLGPTWQRSIVARFSFPLAG